MRGRVPRFPGQLDSEMLTSVLCSGVPGACVTSVSVSGASAGTTSRAGLALTYNSAGTAASLPTRVFVKCTDTLAQRLMLGLGGLIHGEPGFYAAVRPGLDIEAPVGYFGVVDPRTWRSLVVMEDVGSTREATFWRPGTPIDRARIEDLLANVARWHGALWDNPRLEAWQWLRTPAELMRVIDGLVALADRRRAGERRARFVIPASLHGRRRDLQEGLRRSMELAAQGPRTYLHGDLHIANTYLTGLGRMGVVDWQGGLIGSWAFDFGYLLITALDAEDRRAWQGELLAFYLERLSAAGGAAIPYEEAWRAYCRATLYPYFAWLYTIGRARLQPSFQPRRVSLIMLERIASAILDLDSLGAVGL